jgi:hypothetical protein
MSESQYKRILGHVVLQPASSRADAIEQGNTFYFGHVCKRCGGALRYTRTNRCKACTTRANRKFAKPETKSFILNDRKLRELEDQKDDYYNFDLD